MMYRPAISSEKLVLLVSLYIATLCNLTFWDTLLARLDFTSLQEVVFVVNFFLVLVLLFCLIFFLFGQKSLLKITLVFFLVLSAIIHYYNHELGVIIDKEMIRNIVDTVKDHNIKEANELLSRSLLVQLILTGFIPSILVLWCKTNPEKTARTIAKRSVILASLFAVSFISFFANYKFTTYFIRENEDMLVFVTPVYPIVSVKKYIKKQLKNNSIFHAIGSDATRDLNGTKKTIGIFVIGETARADHFSLNGYQRQTNPVLSGTTNILNFENVSSCGTSTAYSVPCMFSFLDQDHYSPEKAYQYSNVLDVLNSTGIHTVWIENNSSCKGVCKRIEEVNLLKHTDPESPFYNGGYNYDDIMLHELDQLIDNSNEDLLIVLHTMGSHGPLYFRRVPEEYSVFKPYCEKESPQECSSEEIINAYDNTIYYTDHFLGQIIERLKTKSGQTASFLMYVSDHGESLGENGVYLHGLPYLIAPDYQTHVPMVMWMSENFMTNHAIDFESIKEKTLLPYTHDNLSHTLLGLFGVHTSLYKKDLDILSTTN